MPERPRDPTPTSGAYVVVPAADATAGAPVGQIAEAATDVSATVDGHDAHDSVTTVHHDDASCDDSHPATHD